MFFQNLHIERCGSVECNIITDVSEKNKISPTVLPLNLAEYLHISKKMSFFVKVNASVITIQKAREVFDSARWIVSMRL